MPPRFSPDALPVDDGPESIDPASRLAELRERVDMADPRAVAERAIKSIRENPRMTNAEAVRILRNAADLLSGITDRSTGARHFYALQSEGRILDRLDIRNRLALGRMETRGRVPVGLPPAPARLGPSTISAMRPVPGPFVNLPPQLRDLVFVREAPNRISFSGQSSAEYTATFHALTTCGQAWHIVGIQTDVLPNGQIAYNSLWECSPSLHNYTYHNMGEDEYQFRSAENAARGYVEILHNETQLPNGEVRYWVVWSQRPNGPMIMPDFEHQAPPYFGPIPPLVEAQRYVRGGVLPPGPRGIGFGPGPAVPPPPGAFGPRPPLRGPGPRPGPLPPPDEFAGGPPPPGGVRPVRFPPGFRG